MLTSMPFLTNCIRNMVCVVTVSTELLTVMFHQAGTKHSLNVAVAGGAVLWHLFAGYISEKKAADETV